MSEAKGHVLFFPYPLQGHINPMIQLAKRLSKQGLTITLIIASKDHREPYTSDDYSITVHTIHDGFFTHEHPHAKFVDLDRFNNSTSRSLTDFISSAKLSANPPKALIYDPFMPFALDVAKDLGLYVVAYFTQPWLASLVYYHINEGTYEVPVDRHENPILASFPGFPLLSQDDLPSFACEKGSYPLLHEFVVRQFSNLRRADCILCNTFGQLEPKVVKWMNDQWPVKNIGPVVPSKYLDNRLPEDKDYELQNSKTEPDESVLNWLGNRPAKSVVYVAFGTLVALSDKQMKETAMAIKKTGYHFLWSVRESERSKLPSGFIEEAEEKDCGLVAKWFPQLEVLAHESIGCFVSHCGWNSTLEALCLGVPMVGMPQWTDQPTNAKFIEDVWKIGVRVKADGEGFLSKEEIGRCIVEVMEGERGKEMRKNAEKLKVLAREAISEGGNSDKNIDEFVALLGITTSLSVKF
ncbi:PREDICTED: UDP-glycosyltransferase 74C1-like [Camelina sativa]|uniref:Glycosyltransferase n=1 Tax=Camelina sativa TaxID=90675 RepID=A0ABM0WDW1_CAMSA|nr:PREDICTED: UDP-glycosyltransferase 74C1-like [Camelina sativa]